MSARDEILSVLSPEHRQVAEALLAGKSVSYPRRVGKRAIETAVRLIMSIEARESVAVRCDRREARANMTDEEFWADVYGDHQGPEPDPVWMEDEPLMEVPFSADTPCTECGATAACGYDSEGRPMIHLQAREDDE